MLCKGRNSNEVVLAPAPPRGDFLRNQPIRGLSVPQGLTSLRITLGKWNEHRLRMTMRFADFVPRYRNARFFAYYEVVQSMDTPENSTADGYVLHVISDGNQDLRKSLTQASIGNSGDFQSTQVD